MAGGKAVTKSSEPDFAEIIVSTLAQGANVDPDIIPPLLKTLDRALEQAQADGERLRAQVLDPKTPEADVAGLSASAQAADIKLQRLSMARDKLAAQYRAAVKRKSEEEAAERKARVVRQRDRVAARLAEAYPRLAAELAAVLRDVAAVSDRCRAINVPGPETIARHLSPQDIVTLVRTVHLPPWDVAQHRLGCSVWPPIKPHAPAIPPAMITASQKLGDAARQTAMIVDQRKREEEQASSRKIPA